MERHESHLFSPYKTLGDVCSDIAPVFRTLAKQKKMIVCAIDNVVVQYTVERLRLVSVSDPMPSKISSLAADKRFVYVGVDKYVCLLHLSRQVDKVLKIGEQIKFIIPFGEVLIVIDLGCNIHVIDIENGEQMLEMDCPESFVVTAVVHPATYIDKILLGSDKGFLRLINVKSGNLIYEFRKSYESEITVLEQSPALDVIGIGLANGKIILLNIKYDDEIMTFCHDESISSLSFRMDGTETFASSTISGCLAVWDLNEKKLIGQLQPHKGRITKLYFLHGEPILVCSGIDNRLETWIFDKGDGMPRKLVSLEGHEQPVCSVKFLWNDCVLSSSLYSPLRLFSVERDTHRQKFGDAGIISRTRAKKSKRLKRGLEHIHAPRIIEMALRPTCEGVWDNLLCRYEGRCMVGTWTTRQQHIGKHVLMHQRFTKNPSLFGAVASAICITACGNFALIGYSSGHIDCFNMQSGIYKNSFSFDGSDERAHLSRVHGLASDALVRQMISGDKTGTVRFWDFISGKLSCEFKVPSPITHFRLNENNSLLAVGVGTGSIGVIDIVRRRVVRIIERAHVGELTALEFSPDGKWLLSAAKDSFVKVWDLMADCLLDVMKFSNYCNGLSFSSSGLYLATSHDDQRSVFIWANRALLSSIKTYKSLPLDYTPPTTSKFPKCRVDMEAYDDQSSNKMDIDEDKDEDVSCSENQLGDNLMDDLICLSGLPRSRWANLHSLQLIKERNKPIEPLEKPKTAPFFMPTVATLEGFQFPKTDDSDGKERRKNIQMHKDMLEIRSPFIESLMRSNSDEEFLTNFEVIKAMNICAIDSMIRDLPKNAFAAFLRMLLLVLKKRRNFELVQSYLLTFLSIHQRLFMERKVEDEVSVLLVEILDEEEKSGSELDKLLMDNRAALLYIQTALL